MQLLAMSINEGKMQEFLEVVELEKNGPELRKGRNKRHVSCAKAARSIQGSCRSAWGTTICDNRITTFIVFEDFGTIYN